jgi:O-antigen ligase
MAFSALSPLSLPFILPLGGIAVIFIAWLIRLPRLAITFLLFTLAAGQLIRLPLPGQGGGLLPSDLAVVAILFIAVVRKILIRATNQINSPNIRSLYQEPARNSSRQSMAAKQTINQPASPHIILIFWLMLPFIAWSLFTLLLQLPNLGFSNTAIAFSYWLRLTAHLLLLPALLLLLQQPSYYLVIWRGFNLTALLLVIIGLAQLIFFPDLSLLAQAGWDPHQWRLVSTWLDPNFLGIFLVLFFPLIFLWQHKVWRLFALTLVIISLAATQSRSALVAAGAAALIFSPLLLYVQRMHRRRSNLITALSIVGLLITISTVFIFTLGPRLTGLVTIDPTVELRLISLASGWQVIRDHPVFGVGYNAYQFVSGTVPAATNYSIHSRAGVDNSWLTIGATTGLLGVILFLLPWAYLLRSFLFRSLVRHDPRALIGLYGLVALFIHSQFINSFLYSHLLITVAIIVALVMPRP